MNRIAFVSFVFSFILIFVIFSCLGIDEKDSLRPSETVKSSNNNSTIFSNNSTTSNNDNTSNSTSQTTSSFNWESFIAAYLPYANATQAGDATATVAQINAVNRLNYYRYISSIDFVKLNNLVNNAAENHANYCAVHGGSHYEANGQSGFTGTSPGDRIEYVTFDWTSYGSWSEDMAFVNNATASCDQLFGTVYHRNPMLNPATVLLGYGGAPANGGSNADVYDFIIALGSTNKVAIYPIDGQKNVPTTFFSDQEGPDPIPSKNAVGYPISIHFGAKYGSTAVLHSGSLKIGSTVVSTFILTPSNDSHLSDEAFILAQDPMQAYTTYTVTMSATYDSVSYSNSWSFTTGAAGSTTKSMNDYYQVN